MQIGGILRFFQLIKDRAGIIRLHHQIENILSLIRLSKYSRYPQSSLIMDIEVEPKIKTLVLFFAR